jgi:glycosyltransferase involved in cell wall biosynthesis
MLSLVIPVYRNEENIPFLLETLKALAAHQSLAGQLELVFVVDGSPDKSYQILRDALPTLPVPSQLLLLSKNFGAFAAIRAGLSAATGSFFAVMAADLQEPPELPQQMYEQLLTNEYDVVIGVRHARADPFWTRLPSQLFWGFYRRFVVPEIPPGGVDIFACNKDFRDQLLQLNEQHSSLVAQIFWLGYRRKFISYTRQMRQQGRSAWTLRKKINYLMDSIFSFTDLPIRLLMRIGACITILSGLFGIIIGILKLLGWIQVPGYAATVMLVVFFGAINLFALGIVGSYAWRVYENTKSRPLHIVLRNHTFNARPLEP